MKEESKIQVSKISLEECLFTKDSCSTSNLSSSGLTINTEKSTKTTKQSSQPSTTHTNSTSQNRVTMVKPEDKALNTRVQTKSKVNDVKTKPATTNAKTPVPLPKSNYVTKKPLVTKTSTSKPTTNKTVPELSDIKKNVTKITKSSKKVITSVTDKANSLENKTDENGKKLSIAEAAIVEIKNNESVDKAIGKAYKSVKKIVVNKNTQSPNNSKKAKKANNKKEGCSQDIIPIRSVNNGVICTTNNKYVKIIEILPINFSSMDLLQQDQTAITFGSVFHNGPSLVHLKVITDKSNPERLINYIKQQCEEEQRQRGISQNVIDCAQDLIDKILKMTNSSALSKRFFFIFEYEGRSSDPTEIIFDLETTKASIVSMFADAGNACIDYGYERSSYEIGEILYYFFNRKTCRTESLQDRINRINTDVSIYNAKDGVKEKEATDLDYISPKGLYTKNPEYIYMDGSYKTFFALKGNGHPSYAPPGWLESVTSIGEGTEVDIHIRRLAHDPTLSVLEQLNLHKRISYKAKANNPTKQDEIKTVYENNAAIIERMKTDEDLFDVCIIFTISADSINELRTLKSILIKQFRSQRFYVEDAYANCMEFFLATLPLTEISTSLFNRNKRNYLTSSLQSLYMFTAFEFYDPTGYVLGENALQNNKSVVAINNFNTNSFTNANMSIFGMTGSGKTYSTEVIARAMRLIGIRVFFICPIKGYEYFHGCDAIDGLYIQLGPGMKDCINICELRPEQNIDTSIIREGTSATKSILSKKLTSLITWIELNMIREPMTLEERDLAELILAQMYSDFGFTNDNDSIYRDKDKRILKDMPVIGDIYDHFMEYDALKRVSRALKKYVTGSCKNMNGQTNVNLSNKYIVFDVDEDNIPKELVPSFLFMAEDCIYGLVKENRLYFDAVFMDEIWKLMITEAAAEQVKDMVKLIRGYGGGIFPITQDINDYLDNAAGRSILAGTATKLIMHLEIPECKRLAKELDLSPEDIRTITGFKRGQAMLITGPHKVLINIRASAKEDEEFTTDPNKLQEYIRKHKDQINI